MEAGRRLIGAGRIPLVVSLLLLGAWSLEGQTLCAAKASNKVQPDRPHYLPSETVLVSGTGFAASCRVTFQLAQPDNTFSSDVALSTDKSGNFSYSFTLTGLKGLYAARVLGIGRALLTSATFTNGSTLTADKGDYRPGETVTMSGSRWLPGETVTLLVHESPAAEMDRTFTSTADASGNILNTSLLISPFDVGVRFLVTATGQTSGFTAQTTFADAVITLVQSNFCGNSSGTPACTIDTASEIKLSYTSAPTAGNLLIVIVSGRQVGTFAMVNSGWSTAIREDATAVAPLIPGQVIYYKIAGASEPSVIDVTYSASNSANALQLFEFSGLKNDSATVLDGVASNSCGGSGCTKNLTSGAVTTHSTTELLLAGLIDKAGSFFTWTSPFTVINDFNTGSGGTTSLAGSGRNTSGAPGSYSAAAASTTADNWRAQIVAFRPQPVASKLALSGATGSLTSGTTRTLTATIQDIDGNTVNVGPDSTLTVTFAQTSGTGSVTGLGTATAVHGVATLNVTGNVAGSVTITASATGSAGALTAGTGNPITFTVVAGAASKLAFGQQPSNTTAGQSISPAVTVRILDANNNLTSSTASVTMAIGTNAGGGTLSGTTTVSAIAGVATFGDLSINKSGAGYTLTASSTGLTGATSSTFSIAAAGASKLNFGTQPSNTTAGVAISPSVTVRIEDTFGNLTNSTLAISVSIGTNAGGGTLSGTTVVTSANGIATFSDLSINKTGTGYTLNASRAGLTATVSNSFNVTAAAANKLNFGTQPSNATAGIAISPSVTVRIEDSFGNLTSSTANVTVAIGTNAGGGTLSGTLTRAAVAGVATFNDLSINKSGTGYTLTAASSGLTGATSNTFNITAAAATHYLVTAPANATAGTAFSVTVTAQDQFNNTATGYGGTAHFTSSDTLAVLPLNYTFLPADNGSHTFTNGFTLNTPGSQTVTATDIVTSSITGSATVVVSSSGSVADFSINVTDGATRAFACSTLTYTIVVTNNGLITVSGATVTDSFPADLTGVTWTCSASAGSSCGAASGSGNISTTVTLAGGGTATYSATGTVARSTNGTLTNTASVAVPVGVTDLNPANDSSTDTDNLNYWVNNATGSDSNPGTQSQPFATLGRAASVVGASGTVYVQVGNSQSGSPYASNVSISGAGQNGTASCPTLFQGIANGSGQLPLVRGADPSADWGFDVASNYVQVDGFQIANTQVALMAEPATTGVIFQNSILQVSDLGYGVILYGTTGALARNNRVEAAGSNSFFGIWDYSGTNDTIDGNKIRAQNDAGIRSDYSSGLLIQRNISRGNVFGIHMANATGAATLYNNTVDANSYLGIYAESPGGTVTGRNNIVTNNGVGWAWNGSGTIDSNFSDVFGNTSNYTFHGTVSAGASSISANPGFVQTTDPALATYYQPAGGSPCINTGVNVGLPFSGSAPDIGAVETQ